jgi:hypothetical protein
MFQRLISCALVGLISVAAQAESPVYRVSQLPEALKAVWQRTLPEMTPASRCAAAFDAGEGPKMTLQCSVYIRMAAEGERRALRLCEDKRRELGIGSTCRLVQP